MTKAMRTDQHPLPRYLRRSDLAQMLGGISRDHIAELIEAGVLPKPIKLSARTKLFDLAEVQAALARAAASP